LIPDIAAPGFWYVVRFVSIEARRMDTKGQYWRIRFRARNTAAARMEV